MRPCFFGWNIFAVEWRRHLPKTLLNWLVFSSYGKMRPSFPLAAPFSEAQGRWHHGIREKSHRRRRWETSSMHVLRKHHVLSGLFFWGVGHVKNSWNRNNSHSSPTCRFKMVNVLATSFWTKIKMEWLEWCRERSWGNDTGAGGHWGSQNWVVGSSWKSFVGCYFEILCIEIFKHWQYIGVQWCIVYTVWCTVKIDDGYPPGELSAVGMRISDRVVVKILQNAVINGAGSH